MRRGTGLLVALAAAWGLGACTVNPATGERDFTAFVSEADEARLGAEQHPAVIRRHGGVYDDRALTAYVREVGMRLVAVSERPDAPYTFTVLDAETPNAFALPGGYVYVTRGLLGLIGGEAELAAVLAHEIGHVVARHPAQRASQRMAAGLGLQVLGAVGGAFGAPPGLSEVASLGTEAYLQGYSREHELEADRLATRYAVAAGYDAGGAVAFFRTLKAWDELDAAIQNRASGEERFSFFSTHPRTSDRIGQAETLAAAADGGAMGRETYLRRIDGLPFGALSGRGVIRGRDFRHAGLGIGFTAPEGFRLANRPDRVLGAAANGAALAFDMADPAEMARTGDLAAYLVGGWARALRVEGVEALSIGGLPAATGRARLEDADGIVDLRMVVVRESRERVFRFLFMTPPALTARMEPAFRDSAHSFRRLTAREAQALAPRRIRLVMVEPGTDLRALAGRMEVEGHPEAWFRVLNGLADGAAPEPGRLVKIVAR